MEPSLLSQADLRKLPPVIKQVECEPTLWPPQARHTSLAKWKDLLSHLRTVLHHIVGKPSSPHPPRQTLQGLCRAVAPSLNKSASDIRIFLDSQSPDV